MSIYDIIPIVSPSASTTDWPVSWWSRMIIEIFMIMEGLDLIMECEIACQTVQP